MTGDPRAWSAVPPASVYERWVRALRAWATDPSIRLEDLPPLSEETYDPQTYARLLTHLETPTDRLMEQWRELLTRALARASDEHELGRELVNLRSLLARRVALSRLPNLPEQIRSALRDDAERAITDIQQQLEESLGDLGTGARIDRASADRLVAVARATPLTDVLTAGYVTPAGRDGWDPSAPATPAPLTMPAPRSPAAPNVRRARWAHRVIGPTTTSTDGGNHA